METKSVRELSSYFIGGGWGDERKSLDTQPYYVIRGADFKKINIANYSELPLRYDKKKRIVSRLLEPGDIVIEISGGSHSSGQSTGRSIFVDDEMIKALKHPIIPASFCRLLRVNNQVIFPKYVYYHLQNMYVNGNVQKYEVQSTGISNFQFEYFLDTEQIRVPPYNEQIAVASILSALDNKIRLNFQINRKLEAIAQALFKSWFIDFDPVRAKAEGRDTGLPEHISSLFPAYFVDSELGQIPEGWEALRFDAFIKEKRIRTEDRDVPEYACTNDGLRLRSEIFTKKLSKSSQSNKLVSKGDIVFGLSRQILNYGVMQQEFGSVSPAYKVFSVDQRVINADFIDTLMRARIEYYFQAVSASSREGQAVSNASVGRMLAIKPSVLVLNTYMDIRRTIASSLKINSRVNEVLISLRDTLLPKLISGELPIPDAERIVGRYL